MDIRISNNKEQHRFEAKVDSKLCELNYNEIDEDTLDYKRTFVPEEWRHQSIGHQLVEQALNYAKEKNYHVKPTCPFVKKIVDEKKEQYSDLVV